MYSQKWECKGKIIFDNGYMLSYLYFFSSGTTVKLYQIFPDVLARVLGGVLRSLSSKGYLFTQGFNPTQRCCELLCDMNYMVNGSLLIYAIIPKVVELRIDTLEPDCLSLHPSSFIY